MKYKNPLLVVCDLEASIAFYREVLGLRVVRDFGANVTLTGGVCLQTKESWLGFLGVNEGAISFGGRDAELYFEEDAFDAFAARLAGMADVRYVHPVLEHRWGQRAVRFYDPDGHIIEVGESMKTVCLRFFASGMTPEETARRMDVPLGFVNACVRDNAAAASSLKRKHAPPCARLWHGCGACKCDERPRANAGCHSSYVKSTQSML